MALDAGIEHPRLTTFKKRRTIVIVHLSGCGHFAIMENEYMKRGYLLPPGCKDLADVLKHKQQPVPGAVLHSLPQIPKGHWMAAVYNPILKAWKQLPALPPLKGQVFIPPDTSVKMLATLLGQKPFQIIGDLMTLGVFAQVDSILNFRTISEVARFYGFTAIKAA